MIASILDQIKISKNTHHKRRINQRLRILPLLLRPTRIIHHWKVDIIEKNGVIWTLKHEISSPKFYDILIKIKLKGKNALNLRNFYGRTKMYLNAVTILREDFLPDYHSIKRYSEFEEYFIPYCYHHYYYLNSHTCTSLGHSLLVAFNNNNFVNSSMAPQV